MYREIYIIIINQHIPTRNVKFLSLIDPVNCIVNILLLKADIKDW